jgi:hypothetical protein
MNSPLLEWMIDAMARQIGCQIEEDGDEYICKHKDFVNLQESDCYAFGRTKAESFRKYLNKIKDDNEI